MSEQPVDGTVLEAAAARPRSTIERIKARHTKKKRHLDLAIPEWDGDVIVRYGRVPKKALAASVKRKNPTAANTEILVAACLEIFLADDEGELEPVAKVDDNPAPVRFDGRLADAFDLTGAQSPREIVLRMYADDVAIGSHAKRILDWQTGADQEGDGLDEELLDEGEA